MPDMHCWRWGKAEGMGWNSRQMPSCWAVALGKHFWLRKITPETSSGRQQTLFWPCSHILLMKRNRTGNEMIETPLFEVLENVSFKEPRSIIIWLSIWLIVLLGLTCSFGCFFFFFFASEAAWMAWVIESVHSPCVSLWSCIFCLRVNVDFQNAIKLQYFTLIKAKSLWISQFAGRVNKLNTPESHEAGIWLLVDRLSKYYCTVPISVLGPQYGLLWMNVCRQDEFNIPSV